MNQTYIRKNDKSIGPFDDALILAGLDDGSFLYDDLCWREGWKEWKLLGTVYPNPKLQIPFGSIDIHWDDIPTQKSTPNKSELKNTISFDEIIRETDYLFRDYCLVQGVEIIGMADSSEERWVALKLKSREKVFISIGTETIKLMGAGIFGLPIKHISTIVMSDWLSESMPQKIVIEDEVQTIFLRGITMQVSEHPSIESLKKGSNNFKNPISYLIDILK
jgi:hypothetical protein